MKPPQWVNKMRVGLWYRLSGNDPDLGLAPTPLGTRYLEDNDPARDPTLNPPYSGKERLRRMLGRKPLAPWHGSVGFSAITEAWNGAVFASRFGSAGSMIVFGGGHNDYFGSDVHAFDLASRQWARITDGYINGDLDSYGTGAVYPNATYPDGSPLPPHTYDYVQYDSVANDVLLAKGQTELGKQVKAIAIPHLLNLDTLRWRQGPNTKMRFSTPADGVHGMPTAGYCGFIQVTQVAATRSWPIAQTVRMKTAPLADGANDMATNSRTSQIITACR